MLLIFGFLFMVFILTVVGIVSQFFHTLINLPSFLLILVPLIFFLFISKSGSVIGKYFVASFKRGYVYTKLEGLSVAIKNTVKFILATGGFNCITFAIISLGHMGNPERLGPNLAISLTSLIYSIAISYFVFFPVQAWAENKIHTLLVKGSLTALFTK
jgi:flagellar motor component MotA